MADEVMVRIGKTTHRELMKVEGQLTARDGYHTTHDLAIQEMVKFWNKYNGVNKSLD
ncbi:MAG: hypothetical protein HY459_02875 [Parcubacteria group bacterium]|nr:hypothetical protein [Parcubacteria group bacterium]